ncbi:alpha/beta hydrolase [Streptomyces sp. NPDC050658]|uniref:alpha/beta hydrolase n=1 Tax=unclassified Streptomyces TaxID=2593676 RepID=UPI0034229C72
MYRADRLTVPVLALALATATLAAATLTGCTAAGGASAVEPAAKPELKRFYGQQLKWKHCGEGEGGAELRCARLTVPMDYAHPENGKTFVLPVVKAVTADPDRRIGSLVYNPGGPGASGASDLRDGGDESFGAKVRARFDIVSFDPRGVGGSTPAVKCAEPPEEESAETDEGAEADAETGEDSYEDTYAPEPITPATAAERDRAVAGADAEAEACRKGSGGILRHVGTEDAARDMDVLRAAIGDRKLTYLGWSYGTNLGSVYAEQFPHRVRALALDGAIDPSLNWRERAVSQGLGFRRAVDDYAEYCADVAGDSCPGATPEEISGLIDDLLEQTEEEPLPVDGDRYDVDATTLLGVITDAMYTPEAQWKEFSEALRSAAEGDGTQLADLAEADEEPGASHRTPRGDDNGSDDNSSDALLAVSCVDIPHPRTVAPYWKALAPADEVAGAYGTSGIVSELACKDWPTSPGTRPPHKVRADGVPPVLVVGTTGDAATPYEEAASLAEQFPGGMLLTYEGLGHTAYGRSNACVTRAVDDYLTDLKPVRSGKTC